MPLGHSTPTVLAGILARLLGGWAHRLSPPSGVADYALELDDRYRLEAHLALTLAELGTIHLPAPALQELGAKLDARSYRRVRRRSRSRTGPDTVRIVEAGTDIPVGARVVQAGDDYYGTDNAGPTLHHPYPMHPWVYALGGHRRVRAERGRPRRIRLFFAGVVNDGYAGRLDFPLMTRPAIVECVRDTFRDDSCVVASRADLGRLRRTDRPIVLVVFAGDVTPMASNHFLARPAYFRLLARSEFALCPPGVYMPHSHNLIEAMAVGTVPVLNYPHFCRPRLVDGTSCLAFATPSDLVATVRRALGLDPAAIAPLRRAVADLYDGALSPDGAARSLAALLDDPDPDPAHVPRLILNREFPAARAWSAARGGSPD